MEKIEKLKIGNYVLKIDKFLKKVINYLGVDLWIDHCEGSKTFKNIGDYNKFCNYLKYSYNRGINTGAHKDIIFCGDLVIHLIHNSTLTINYEIFDAREQRIEYDHYKYEMMEMEE